MSKEILSVLNSSTPLSNTRSVESEDRVYTVVRSEGDKILADDSSEQVVFFNLEQNREFDKKGIVFEPRSHRIGRDGNRDYITVEKVLYEFDKGVLDKISTQAKSGRQESESEPQDGDNQDQNSVGPFSTEEVDQNVGNSNTISVTSTDSDMLSDIDVHRF